MIDKAKQIYMLAGGDFHSQLGWHLVNGFVISLPLVFCMGYWCMLGDERVAVDAKDANCACFTYVCGDMKASMTPLVDTVQYVTFQREIKGDSRYRTYDFKTIYEKL